MTINSLKRQKWLALLLGSFFLTSSAFAALTTPTVTNYPQFASSTPVTVSGTADASTTITIVGGASTSTASTNGSGSWTATVGLTPSSVNHLSITADDGMGSTSAAATVDITFDNTTPVFGTTTDITATTTSSAGTHVSFADPAVTDDMSSSVTVTCAPVSGSLFTLGTTTVNCTASDESGNSASTTFDVIVSQVTGTTTTATTTLPVTITNPTVSLGQFCTAVSPVTISGTSDANADIRILGGTSTATTTANGAGHFTTTVGLNANASTPLVIEMLDASSNVVASTTVNAVFDNTAPVITVNQPNYTSAFQSTNFVDPGASATDNLGASTTVVTTGHVDTSTLGTYTLTYTATDCAGNTASTTRNVEVVAQGGSTGGSNTGGGSSSGSNSGATGLVNAGQVANPNSAVAYVLAGIVIDDSPLRLRVGIPNTGGTFTFMTLMSQGLRGIEVTELQTLLKELGFYNGPITGQFGPLTRAAVMAYQRAHGITQTGNVGVKTLAALNASILASR
ncbi:DUF5011 domain-containing protein [Candidatus Parcubacteria bacterium]|nr:DUF5011 domain-containing protein [Candidatus Parcubacteria bacterium]